MQAPLYVRALSPRERARLEAGLRSPNAFELRRGQILLASARPARVPAIAQQLGCDEQTVRNAIHAFNRSGRAALQAGAARPHTIDPAVAAEQASRLRALVRPRPRAFGQPTSVGTLPLLANVRVAEGLTARATVSGETVRQPRKRLGLRWTRATGGLSRPDPADAAKKPGATG